MNSNDFWGDGAGYALLNSDKSVEQFKQIMKKNQNKETTMFQCRF